MHAPDRNAAVFVTSLGWISLVLAALGSAWALAQFLVGLLIPDALVADLAAQGLVPPLLANLFAWRNVLALAMLGLSLALLASAWGLLRRREWARLAFIALLVFGALANFAALAGIDPLFDSALAMFPASMRLAPEGQQAIAQLQSSRRLVWVTSLGGALAIAGVHAWIAWQLCTAPVRAQFGPPRD
ncbi:hypothetical protein [Pseudoxanthomonas koreensis]|uniref:hypothetical protein n=1 Tax=Pseudoxanthomonas koreensis TaxID=266061 RepID=UPI001391B754|nr:hypothetical protein [Pseudoxanthomonas koreensis]